MKKGLPFRDAHEVVGKAVAAAIELEKDLAELELGQLQQFSDLIADDVFDVLTVEGSLAARNHHGATSPEQVRKAVAAGRARLQSR